MQNLSRALRLRQLHSIPPRSYQLQQLRRISDDVYRNGQALRIQRVHFKERRLPRPSTWWRLIAGTVFTFVAVQRAAGYFLAEIDEETRQGGPKELTEEEVAEQLDEAVFVPLTWATKQPRIYYNGDDPEWQEFIRIAKDKETREQIKTDARQLISEGALKHPVIHKWLGQEPRFGRCWIEFHFPDGPPEEYSRIGIFWATDFIATGIQNMTTEEYQQWSRSIWPAAAGQSAWAAVKVLVGMQIRRVQQSVGYAEVDPSSPEEKFKLWRTLVQRQEAMRAAETGKSQTSSEGEGGNGEAGSGLVSKTSSATSSTRTSEFPLTDRRLPSWLVSDTSKSSGQSSDSASLPGASSLDLSDPSSNSFSNLDIPVAMMVFRQTYKKHTTPQLRDYRDIPRGNFIVQGLVEMMGTNGRVQFDLMSAYDPEEKKFVNAVVKVRGHYPKMQAPKGGNRMV